MRVFCDLALFTSSNVLGAKSAMSLALINGLIAFGIHQLIAFCASLATYFDLPSDSLPKDLPSARSLHLVIFLSMATFAFLDVSRSSLQIARTSISVSGVFSSCASMSSSSSSSIKILCNIVP